MSFALTTPQIKAREKTVTRRLGWKTLKPWTLLQPVEKAQGLKKGEHPVKIGGPIRVISVRRESLAMLVDDYRSVFNYGRGEVNREGFPHRSVQWFVDMFMATHRCRRDAEVTRIEFEYVDVCSTCQKAIVDEPPIVSDGLTHHLACL